MVLSAVSAHAQENGIERFGVYVAVSDIDRAQRFYERLFQKQPYVRNDRFAGFEIAGALYAIFRAADPGLVKGNNAVPYIRVKDASREFERVKALEARLLDDEVLHEGPLLLFKFADPDGNVIEFYSVAPAVSR